MSSKIYVRAMTSASVLTVLAVVTGAPFKWR
jgi:hypothetical protein